MKTELEEIKTKLAAVQNLIKSRPAVKHGVAVASSMMNGVACCEEDDDKEEVVFIDDVIGLRSQLDYLSERISNLWSQLYEHADTGHLPPIVGAGKMNSVLEILGLSGDYVVQPKTVYASTNGIPESMVLTITKKAA